MKMNENLAQLKKINEKAEIYDMQKNCYWNLKPTKISKVWPFIEVQTGAASPLSKILINYLIGIGILIW